MLTINLSSCSTISGPVMWTATEQYFLCDQYHTQVQPRPITAVAHQTALARCTSAKLHTTSAS